MSRFHTKRTVSICCTSLCFLVGSGPAPAKSPKTAKSPKSSPAAPVRIAGDNSLPRQSGPGIVVCEPIASAPSTDGDFGAGCALWLQMNVGGQPLLGKTPLWESLGRARTEMGRPDLRLSAAEALRLAPILGVTHAAVGTLHGAEPHLTLTYRLLQLPAGIPIGPPVILNGSRTQIAASLPQAAQTLTKLLGVVPSGLPATAGLTPADLNLLGRVRWQGTLTDAQQASVEEMAARSPLAGLLNLSRGAGLTGVRFNAAVRTLLDQAGGNTLVWGEIAWKRNLSLLPHAAELTALTGRFPGSYNLAVAETFRYRAVADHTSEKVAAERVVQDAPHNPEGWLTEAYTISDAAGSLRQGRYYGALTPEEADTLGHLYSAAEAAAQRAAHLDPAFAKAWLRLAQAATFNSDAALADYALQTAFKLSGNKSEVYGWALEMYQPKWNGDPAKLNRFAQAAATDVTLDAAEVISLATKLRSSGHPDLNQKIWRDFILRRRTFLATHPNDGEGHWGLATVLAASGEKQDALVEYRTAAALLPQSAVARYDLGTALYVPGTYTQAISEFQEAVRIDPDYPDAHFYLGYALRYLSRFEEAKRELHATLLLSPAFGKAYAALGDVLQLQGDVTGAIPEYEAAIRFGAYTKKNYESLIGALSATAQYEQVLTNGEAALRVYPAGDAVFYNDMADAYLHKQEWDKSVALSHAAIALNAGDPVAHENLGEAYLGAGRTADAQAEWRKVLTLQDEKMKSLAQGYLKKYP